MGQGPGPVLQHPGLPRRLLLGRAGGQDVPALPGRLHRGGDGQELLRALLRLAVAGAGRPQRLRQRGALAGGGDVAAVAATAAATAVSVHGPDVRAAPASAAAVYSGGR